MTPEELDSAMEEADRRMKASNGHQFMTVLKTRCVHCNRSPKVKTRCGQWFQTFISNFKTVLRERDFVETSAGSSHAPNVFWVIESFNGSMCVGHEPDATHPYPWVEFTDPRAMTFPTEAAAFAGRSAIPSWAKVYDQPIREHMWMDPADSKQPTCGCSDDRARCPNRPSGDWICGCECHGPFSATDESGRTS